MKKWTYLAVAGMLLGSAPVFTGCVDTDEPYGIEQLRGAKAQLLQAKAAVEQARVAYVQAQAELESAKAETERANAQLQSEQARAQQIANDLQEAKNEIEIQRLQAELEETLANIENAKELAEINHQKDLALAQQEAAAAQFAYETILKQIEIAKALGLTDTQQATLENLKGIVENKYQALYAENSGLAYQLRQAKEDLYNAQMNKEWGSDTDGDIWIPRLEAEVELAKVQLTAAQTQLEDLQALADKDIAGTDWAAEIDALETEIAELKVQVEEKEAELVRQHNTPEYLKLYQAVNGVYDKYKEDGITPADDAKPVKNGTAGVLEEKEIALAKAANEDKKSFNIADFTTTTEVTETMAEALNDVAGILPDELPSTITIKGAQNFLWGNDGDKTKTPTDAQNVLDQYDSYLNILKNVVWVDENEIAQAQATLNKAKEAEEAAKKVYEKAYAEWETVKDIIANETDYQVDITDFKKVTDAYNTAYAALQTAITNWNNGLQAAYDEAYDEAYNEAILDIMVEALGGGTAEQAISQITAIQGFDAGKVIASWDTYSEANKTEANLNNLIAMNCTAYTNGQGTQVTAAQIQAQVKNVLDAYVRQETSALDWADNEAEIERIAKDAADSFITTTTGTKLDNALKTANTNVANAYAKIDPAMDAYVAMAATFAQVTDEKVFNIDYLVSALDKDGKPTTVNTEWYAKGTGDNVIGKTAAKYVINNSDITSAELTAATKTTFSEDLYDTALDAVSKAAFGVGGRYAPVAIDKAEGGAAKTYQEAINEVAKQEAIISANDDLKALQTELNTAYTNIKTDLAAQYDKVFATEVAAVDEAKKNDAAARAELAKADEQFYELNIEIGELNAEKAGKEAVKNTLTQLVNDYLEGTGIDYDPATFESQLQAAVANQKIVVATAEQNVKKAEVELKKAQEGAYDDVAYYTFKLEIVQGQYDAAVEEYQKAQEDLAKAMEIMAGTTSDEQPAE